MSESDTDLSPDFVLGLQAGLMLSGSPCDLPECPRKDGPP
jgi:hypothetical protein